MHLAKVRKLGVQRENISILCVTFFVCMNKFAHYCYTGDFPLKNDHAKVPKKISMNCEIIQLSSFQGMYYYYYYYYYTILCYLMRTPITYITLECLYVLELLQSRLWRTLRTCVHGAEDGF